MNSTEILKSTEMDTYSQNLISSDTDLLNKVKQVIELTGCSNDIAVTTLYDSNYNIEIAIDKIFEQTQRTLVGEINKINSDWKEVAKYKKKQSLEMNPTGESHIDVKEITDNKIVNDKAVRPVRGSGRGRARFTQNYNRNYDSFNNKPPNHGTDDINDGYGNRGSISRGRGGNRRSQYRLNSNRGRTRHYMNQENDIFDGNMDGESNRYSPGESNKWNSHYDVCNDWLSDNTAKSNDGTESDKPYDNNYYEDANSALRIDKFESTNVQVHVPIESCMESADKPDSVSKDESKVNQLNPLDLVAKCTNKVDIFGGFSRTKPPTPSTRVPLEPVKLLTATGGVMSVPVKTGFNFSFGLNFNDYSSSSSLPASTSQSTKFIDSSESFISKIISNQPFDGIVSANKTKTQTNSKSPLSLIPVAVDNNRSDDFLQSNFSDKESNLRAISMDKSTIKSKPDSKSSGDMFSGQSINQQRHIDNMTDKNNKLLTDPNIGYKMPDCVGNNHQSLNTLNTTILSSSPQLCPPPGMSNAHLLQQFQNNPQYFSLLNIPNGSSIFSGCNLGQVNDMPDAGPSSSSDDSAAQQAFMHNEPNKDFSQKHSINSKHQSVSNSSATNQQTMLQKPSDSDNPSGAAHSSSTILSAMTMPNICCFPQVYMNTFANFMPTAVPGGQHSSSVTQSTEVTQSSVAANKPIYNLPMAHRNYPLVDDFDELIQNKQKFQRSQNYVTNFGGKTQDDGVIIEVDNKSATKLVGNSPAAQSVSRQPSQSQQQQNIGSSNRAVQQQQQQQQSVSNDPRFLAFHHQHSNHPYQNNMFNCVTATGAHPSAHPYAMAHQGGGLQQLHPQLQLMQQQMHNFPQSYQFQEHLMTSMVNPSSRSNNTQGSGSSGNNQSRSNRSSNQLWHP